MSLDVADFNQNTPKKGRILRVALSALAIGGVLGGSAYLVVQPAIRALWEPAIVLSARPLQTLRGMELRVANVLPDHPSDAIVMPELAGYEEKQTRSLAPARAPRISVAQRSRVQRQVVDTFQQRVAAPVRAPQTPEADAQEREALAQVYRNLKRQFLVSLISDKVPMDVATQTVLATLDPIPAPAREKKWLSNAKSGAAQPSSPTDATPELVAAASPVKPQEAQFFDPPPVLSPNPSSPDLAVTTHQAAKSRVSAEVVERTEVTSLSNQIRRQPEAPPLPESSRFQQVQREPQPEPLLARSDQLLAQVESLIPPSDSPPSFAQISRKLAEIYPLRAPEGQQRAQAPKLSVTTQSPQKETKTETKDDYSKETQTGLVPVTTQFVEFFDSGVAVDDAYSTELTQDHRSRGWRIATSALGFPTLYWVNGSDPGAPILSKNSAEVLARKAGLPVNDRMSIVMGRIPRGFRVDPSSRAERVLYIDEQRQITDEVDVRGDRDFILFNVKPGFEIISFSSATEGQGGIAIPLIGGHATYVDLRSIEAKNVSGQMLLAANPPRGIAGVKVQVVGQKSAVAISGKGGHFSLASVLTIRGMDLFIESQLEDGFSFRYSVGADETQGLELYRLSDADVTEWVNQLEGGVSEQSGLIVAAMPRWVSAARSAAIPMIETLATDPVLAPEVYGISPEGQLIPQGRVDVVSSRVLGAQIPEGPTRLSFEAAGERGPIQWSTLLPSSPRVIHLISH